MKYVYWTWIALKHFNANQDNFSFPTNNHTRGTGAFSQYGVFGATSHIVFLTFWGFSLCFQIDCTSNTDPIADFFRGKFCYPDRFMVTKVMSVQALIVLCSRDWEDSTKWDPLLLPEKVLLLAGENTYISLWLTLRHLPLKQLLSMTLYRVQKHYQ